jgi:hypothetical protein
MYLAPVHCTITHSFCLLCVCAYYHVCSCYIEETTTCSRSASGIWVRICLENALGIIITSAILVIKDCLQVYRKVADSYHQRRGLLKELLTIKSLCRVCVCVCIVNHRVCVGGVVSGLSSLCRRGITA